jgi:hypothetical protein
MKYDETVSILTSALQREQFTIGEWRRNNQKKSPEVRALPFYQFVPKDPIRQMRWRDYARDRAMYDLEWRDSLYYACKKDILFACNTLIWIYEPRPIGRRLPFNTWADQDNYIVWIRKCMDQGRDIGVEKCRGVGWSWLVLAAFYCDWLWLENLTGEAASTLGIMSRKMDGVVDDKENPDALMWKLEYMHRQMPQWVRQDGQGKPTLSRNTTAHKFSHTVNQNTIYGYEATSNVMTGGRKRAILHDEAAKYPPNAAAEAWNSTQHVTNCRVVVGTYFRGTTTVFFNIMRVEESSMLKVHAHWRDNPERMKGAYKFEDGKLIKLDPTYKYPKGYQFIDIEHDRDEYGNPPKGESKVRSPWYDVECNRPGTTRAGIAEELDINPSSASTQYVEQETIDLAKRMCTIPRHRGNLEYDDRKHEAVWVNTDRGNFRLYKPLTVAGRLAGGPFHVGIDVAGGSGGSTSSNSSMVAWNEVGETVLVYYSNAIMPTEFANLAYATALWLADDHGQRWVTINHETNGPGEYFDLEIHRLGWGNYYRQEETTNTGKTSFKRDGFRSTKNSLGRVLSILQRAILKKEATILAIVIAEELGQFQLLRGKVIHSGSHFDPDGDSTGDFHGDVAFAASLGWLSYEERNTAEAKEVGRPIPLNSLAHRILQASRRSKAGREDDIDQWWEEPDEMPFDEDYERNPLLQMIHQNEQNPPTPTTPIFRQGSKNAFPEYQTRP